MFGSVCARLFFNAERCFAADTALLMVNYYDELEIEDFAWDPAARVFHYPCPCGDRFEISKAQLRDGEEIATCPSCSLIVRVIYDYVSLESCPRSRRTNSLSLNAHVIARLGGLCHYG